MTQDTLSLWIRIAIFVVAEGFFAWRLVLGLRRRQFQVGDDSGSWVATRREHPIRYWSWAAMLVGTMIVFAVIFCRALRDSPASLGS